MSHQAGAVSWSRAGQSPRQEGQFRTKPAGPHASRFPTSLPRQWTVDTPVHQLFLQLVSGTQLHQCILWNVCLGGRVATPHLQYFSTALHCPPLCPPCVHCAPPSRQWPLSKPCQQCFAKGWRSTVKSVIQLLSKWLNVSGGSQVSYGKKI